MPEYLWEVELSNDNCGWLDIIMDAIKNYPNGKTFTYRDINNCRHRTFIHPIKYRDRMLFTFNKYKERAIELSTSVLQNDLRISIQQLILCDVCLYNIIHDWQIECKLEAQPELFNPHDYFDNENYVGYHAYLRGWHIYPEIDDMRLINNLYYSHHLNIFCPKQP